MNHFRPLLTLFEPFLTLSGLYRAIFGQFWDQKNTNIGVVVFGDFGPFLGHLGTILASFWGSFGVVLTPFWDLFGPVLPILFCPFLDHFYDHVAVFFYWFLGKLTATLSNVMQVKAEVCNFPPNLTKKYAKLCKNKPFFGYKILVLLKKTVKIDVSTYERVQ